MTIPTRSIVDPTNRYSRRRGVASIEWVGVVAAVVLVVAFGIGLVGDVARTSLDTNVNGRTGILGRQAEAAHGGDSGYGDYDYPSQ